ncbi:SGNH/GDSL hydrolase family protein [bacterium]|nr:SGNH/GDSL hydrolase family protein [candidate division CSSED10-310 bacterium]
MTQQTPGRIRRFIYGLITILLTTFLCLILLEGFFRVACFQPRGRVAVPYEFQLSDLAGVPYELTPNHQYEWKYGPRRLFDRGFSIPVRINEMGFRDDPVILPKPEGTIRILAVGDSFTWGLGVAEEDCWVEQLEWMLQKQTTRKVDVINTGVGSWNTEVEAAFLQGRGMALDPDAVILGFLINDFRATDTGYAIDDRGYLVTRYKDAEGRGEARKLHLQSLLYEEEPRGNILIRIAESSHLVRWISSRQVKTEPGRLMMSNDGRSKTRTWNALARIYMLTQEVGIPLYVLIFPNVEDPILAADKADLDELASLCQAAKVPSLRMETALTGIPPQALWVHPRDRHPNARAHHLYAQYIVSSLFTNIDDLFCEPIKESLKEETGK